MFYVKLKARGEGGLSSITLLDGWSEANVEIYCFATSKNGRMVSDSMYLTV